MKTIYFPSSWLQGPDDRPRIKAIGSNGKTGWIEIEYRGSTISGQVTIALLKRLKAAK